MPCLPVLDRHHSSPAIGVGIMLGPLGWDRAHWGDLWAWFIPRTIDCCPVQDWCIMEGCDGGIEPHPDAASIKEQEWLWRTSSEIVGFKDPYDHRFDY